MNGNQLMLHLVPPTRFTEGMAWMGAMNSIGGSVGSAIAGQFIDRMGSHGGFIVVTTLALASLVIALFGFKQIRELSEKQANTKPVYCFICASVANATIEMLAADWNAPRPNHVTHTAIRPGPQIDSLRPAAISVEAFYIAVRCRCPAYSTSACGLSAIRWRPHWP